MLRGAQALANISPNGAADLCVVVDDIAILIDVKLAQWSANDQGWQCTGASKVKPPIYPVVVIPIGDNMSEWEIKWHKKRDRKTLCPPGLENFWD